MFDFSCIIIEYGQILCGCSMLVMVDGVLLNINCDFLCNLVNIDLVLIEWIEVICGSSVIYGSGVIGGIIFIIICLVGGENCVEICFSVILLLIWLGSDGFGGQFQ